MTILLFARRREVCCLTRRKPLKVNPLLKKEQKMKNKLGFVLVAFCLMVTAACSQVDQPTAGATDDATMGRLRVAYIIFNGLNVDVLVDGEIAMFGPWEQTDLSPGYVGGYLYLEPGTHSVAVVPTGQGVEDALLSEEVTLEAGHRYTVATMGQVEDESLTPLVIDETAAVQQVRTDPGQTIVILVNNLAGAETLSITFDGQGPKNAPYGGFAVAPLPLGPGRYIEVTANNGKDVIETAQEENGDTETPGENFIHLRFGHFPGTWGEDHSDTQGISQSDLNALEFLQVFSGLGAQRGGHALSFDTFLKAVETAGLTDVLKTGSPYWLLAPTDEAFAALPQDRLEALMADPEALADLLRNHIIGGYFPDLPDPPTSMTGIVLDRNSIPFIDLFLLLDNGTHLSAISSLLLPPDEACRAEQAAPPNIIPPRFLTNHTVSMWLFDEGEGNTAGDASGHDHHGTFVNASWAEGKFGSAAQIIPGENYVEVETTDDALSPAKEMTVTAWVYLTALPDPEEEFPNRRILEAASYDPKTFEYGGGDNHYGLHFEWGRFIFRPGPNAQPGSIGIDQSEAIEPGKWQHVAGVYSGAFVRLYINGELRAEVKSNCEALVQPKNNRLFIGTKAPEAPDGDYWDGLLDEVAIFDVALTEEEIGSVMQGLGGLQAE